MTLLKRKQGGEPVSEEIDWPTYWPVPTPGSIVTGTAVGGWVEHIEFDLPSHRMKVVLR